MINLVTINTGGHQPHDVTNTIHRLAEKHYTGEMTHYCITDNPHGLADGITIIDDYTPFGGWWDKINLFSPCMPKGRFLYLDLDCLPVGDITPLVEAYSGQLMGDEDPIHFGKDTFTDHAVYGSVDCSLGTAFLVGDAGKHKLKVVYKRFNDNVDGYKRVFARHGDQVFTSWALGGKFDLLERVMPVDHGFYSYKFDMTTAKPANLVGRGSPGVPRLINFHGKPKWWELKHLRLVADAIT